MILLTVYQDPIGKRENREFSLLQDAIEFGQKTGSDYDIFDPGTGKLIDWNEINVRDEDEWYYDEKECLWKKIKSDDGFYNGITVQEKQYGLVNQNPSFHGKVFQY